MSKRTLMEALCRIAGHTWVYITNVRVCSRCSREETLFVDRLTNTPVWEASLSQQRKEQGDLP